ncbi:MAG: 2-oxoglutarate dehydrogenase E1 component [Aurantimonas endophytica]|uniref:2-oxoglutarate dehydrogenase E1 component n=1 Tax=Aurantimonas endophytica TaxID=1522175 RepID=UPI003002445B
MKQSPFLSASAAYLEDLQEKHGVEPGAVSPDWRFVFDAIRELEGLDEADRCGLDSLACEEIRDRGHLVADLDPLHRVPADGPGRQTAETRLRELYCGSLSLESAHIDDAVRRNAVRVAFEARPQRPGAAARRRAFDLLVAAEEFELLLGTRYPTKKRFGIEGGDTLIPLVDRLLHQAAMAGIDEVHVGTMHRGRLNLMANVFGMALPRLFATFIGTHPFATDMPVPADVPYHLGHGGELRYGERLLRVVLSPNPSHLEAVNPVVLGRTRAAGDRRVKAGGERRKVLAILLHTDASVVGQGSVAETCQLAELGGFGVGGTIHVVVNNQIGFTTNRDEARSSRHCTGIWKSIDSPIFHVNGDEPDAALLAADLAVAARNAHDCDTVIDLVCYRRKGHNEIDEPRFTHPTLYRTIGAHKRVRQHYAEMLAEASVIGADDEAQAAERWRGTYREGLAAAEEYRPNADGFPNGIWAAYAPTGRGETGGWDIGTGVERQRLESLIRSLAAVPATVEADDKVARLVGQRADAIEAGLNWAVAEAACFATLLTQGVPVRLSGQDVIRGAFSHRHFAITDTASDRRHISLNQLSPDQAWFDVVNSPLSEHAVLGFEYGYSLDAPEALVIWEAQFGDFANGAQIIVDQFVCSAEDKWRQPSGLVMLLPHGLEGQGPEHSSARMERFLQLAARDNIQIANPSTPANYFHLLRRQVLAPWRKPLIVMSPKTLLRLPAAVSPLTDFDAGTRFRPVIASCVPDTPVDRVLLCTGKIAYELERRRGEDQRHDGTAIVRLERLYPLPVLKLVELFRRWPDAAYRWVQEEPENFGAWRHLDRRIESLLTQAGVRRPQLACVARPEAASPAGSFHGDHDRDQAVIVEAAFAAG